MSRDNQMVGVSRRWWWCSHRVSDSVVMLHQKRGDSGKKALSNTKAS